VIDGVVISFAEISELVALEAKLRALTEPADSEAP
jgi:hypothetical protein